ncbi:MAG: hypothetical protein KGZ68_10990 [Dechloromonas sp.]|nr:hypothetical protein [Dechloromonas sp.]
MSEKTPWRTPEDGVLFAVACMRETAARIYSTPVSGRGERIARDAQIEVLLAVIAELGPSDQKHDPDEGFAIVGVIHGDEIARRNASKALTAKSLGYTGDQCPDCGNFTMVRNGVCLKCNTCGATTGCS